MGYAQHGARPYCQFIRYRGNDQAIGGGRSGGATTPSGSGWGAS